MRKDNQTDEITNMVRQSVVDSKCKKQKEKHCLKDFSGEIFELTADMLVEEHYFNKEEKSELAGVAECILRKYEKILSVK
jgi:hypothetical protein